MYGYTFLFVFSCVLASAICQYPPGQSIMLHDTAPYDDTIVLTLKASKPILPDLSYSYFCNGNGVWVLYQGSSPSANYSRNGWIHHKPRVCLSTQLGIKIPIGSAYFVESSRNPNIVAINLFPGDSWAGAEQVEIFKMAQPYYSGTFNSTIVTGTDALTFYTESNYQGRAICLKADDADSDAPVPFARNLDVLGVEAGEIKSFQFGCFGSNIVSSD